MGKSLTVHVSEGNDNKGFVNAALGTLLVLGILGLVFWGIWSFISYVVPFVLVIYAAYIVVDETRTFFKWPKYLAELPSLNDMTTESSDAVFKPNPEHSELENAINKRNFTIFTFFVLILGIFMIMLDHLLRVFVTYYFGSAQDGHLASYIGFILVFVFAYRVLTVVPTLYKFIRNSDKSIKGNGKFQHYFFVVFNKIVKVLVILFYGMCLAANFGIYIGW